ncbi:MAG: class I SAM-dependent methyltransferase [Propionibacteriales bacterium]|nr:class I SAM-dependent methyltransferase [Propionibacteriales bacterium]
MGETRDYTSRNRRGWDIIAPSRPPEPAEFFLRGGTTLEDMETDALPQVAGLRLLHLACASGNESLSWASRGASVVGVDISEVAVQTANTQAEATGLDARFVSADIYALPQDLGVFDVVYASWGVVCWLPDLAEWASIVSARLIEGGTLLLCEHHPVWEVLGVVEGAVQVTVDYFGRGTPTQQEYDDAKRPVGWTPDAELSSFAWPLSDVVMSLVAAGLRLEQFSEFPLPRMYDGLGSAASWLPATYLIKATKN